MMQAIHTAWGAGADVTTCYYHLSQSLWRRMQAEGLKDAYRETWVPISSLGNCRRSHSYRLEW